MTNDIGSAALTSWAFDGPATALLLAVAFLYLRGWKSGRNLLRGPYDREQCASFLGGLFLIFIAIESPLDAFDSLFLSAHMTQHLILMMFAPPLLLLGQPVLPLLRGLPRRFVKAGLGPFLTWRLLRRILHGLTAPPVAWLLFAGSTVLWHVPALYELALRSPAWHSAEHACFFWTGILFWWPVIQPAPGKSHWPAWAPIPYLLLSDFVNTGLSALFIFSGKVLYPSYAEVHIGHISALDDQALAGAIMWVPGSLVYLIPAFLIAFRLISRSRPQPVVVTAVVPRREVMVRLSGKRFQLFAPRVRRGLQVVMLLLAVLCIVDGLRGPQITETNLAGVLPWIHWRVLSLIALLLLGNLFCAICPFTLFRDFSRWFLPANRRWPRALRNKWIPVVLLLLYFWAYEAFSLWNSPYATACIILGYFGGAVLIDGFFRGASFCKYVCPIGQFHFVVSSLSPREVAVKERQVCDSCKSFDCIRGNERSRGCELNLFQPKKIGNLDCTFCLDCIKACPHENVQLTTIAPASTLAVDPYRSSLGRLSNRTDLLVLALLVVFGAFVNAGQMVAPVMMWEHHWHARLGVYSMPLIVGAVVLTGCLIVPFLSVRLCGFLSGWRTGDAAIGRNWRRFSFALIPIGVSMWAAHLFFHGLTSWSGAYPAFQRFISGSVFAVPAVLLPTWLPDLQILTLDAGLLLTLWLLWRTATQMTERNRPAVRMALPWAALSCSLYALGVWILSEPMQMRGMVH